MDMLYLTRSLMFELIIFTEEIVTKAAYEYAASMVPNPTFTFYTYRVLKYKPTIYYKGNSLVANFLQIIDFSVEITNDLPEVHTNKHEKPGIFAHDKPMLHKSHKLHQPWPFLLDKCAVIKINQISYESISEIFDMGYLVSFNMTNLSYIVQHV